MSESRVVLLLALLMGLQPITTDLYLPALPALSQALTASSNQTQLTLSGLMLAFGVSQLLWGPLSDRIGRRPVVLLGLTLHALSALVCALAPVIEVLLAGRLLQGAALGAAVTCARAIVRDCFSGTSAVRVMSRGLSGVAVMVTLAIPLGGISTTLLGWRLTLLIPGLLAAASALWIYRYGRESLTRRNPAALQPAHLLATWRTILSHRGFLAFTLLNTASFVGVFCLLASSSFVFMRGMALTPLQYGALMCSITLCFALGTLLCRRLLNRLSLKQVVLVGGALSLGSATLMLIQPNQSTLPGFALAGCYLFMLAHGIHHTCGQSGAAAAFPQAAGSASALNGCLMLSAVFVAGQGLGSLLSANSVQALTLSVGICALLSALLAWTLLPGYLRRTSTVETPPE